MNLREAETLGEELVWKHLGPYSANWRFQWDRSVRRHGYCNYQTKVISLSAPLTEVNTVEHVRHTILHEIAHGLAYHKFGAKGHGYEWQRECRLLGIPATRCHPVVLVTVDTETGTRSITEAVRAVAPLRGICPFCSASYSRFRMPSGPRYCTKCYNANGNQCHSSFVLTWYKVDADGTVLKRMGTGLPRDGY